MKYAMVYLIGYGLFTAYVIMVGGMITETNEHFAYLLAFLAFFATNLICTYLTTKQNLDTRLTVYKLVGIVGVLGGISIFLLLPDALVLGFILCLGSMIATGVVREIELANERTQ